MSTPTPAQKTLQRVLKISRLNGWSVAIFGALSVLGTLALGDLLGIFIGLSATLSGAMEIRGGRQLQQRNADGVKLLVRAQLFLLAVMLSYCASRLGSFDIDTAMANITPDMETVLQDAGLQKTDVIQLVRSMFIAIYSAVGLTCLIYQDGLALYYRHKTKLIIEALTTPLVVPTGYSSPY